MPIDDKLNSLVNDLASQLQTERQQLRPLNDYYTGQQRLAFSSTKYRSAFGDLFNRFADNWCELVVDAVEERLNVEGFRLGDDTAGDTAAWDIWQRNLLDADSQIAHTEALVFGRCYASVWGDRNDQAVIRVESPLQMIVHHDDGDRRARRAALKVWGGTWGLGPEQATLYLPDSIVKLVRDKRDRWELRDEGIMTNPLGVVPVVPIVNKPRLLHAAGRSELANVVPMQDAVNKLLADLLVASEFGAFRQRWATGIELPVDPATGAELEPFKVAIDRLWTSDSADTKFGEFGATDLNNYVKAIELVVQHIASQTRTPPHYFYLSGNFPSGESIKSAETGLVAKARRKQRHFGDSWEEVMRLALAVEGQPTAGVHMETLWGDPESRSEAELADAMMKQSTLGVPRQAIWERLGYSQVEISRFKAMEAGDALARVVAGAAAPATPF